MVRAERALKDKHVRFMHYPRSKPVLHPSAAPNVRSLQGLSTREGEEQLLGLAQRPWPGVRQRWVLLKWPSSPRSWQSAFGTCPRPVRLLSRISTQPSAFLGCKPPVDEK